MTAIETIPADLATLVCFVTGFSASTKSLDAGSVNCSGFSADWSYVFSISLIAS
ncbi:MAG TPA: hypothetical protein VGB00_01625 [Pyrinomonadaceae bacterium]